MASEDGFLEQQQRRAMEELESMKRRFGGKGTQIHVTTLDEVVSVNSFFTIAVFLGLSFTTSTSHPSLDSSCNASDDALKKLLVYEVISFSCFLFSSLVAHGLKLYIIFANSNLKDVSLTAEMNNRMLRLGMLASAVGSVAGTVFLLLSMITIIELRLGPFSCRTTWTERASIPLITLVTSGITIFLTSVVYAFLH